jgi:hypothetical protein
MSLEWVHAKTQRIKHAEGAKEAEKIRPKSWRSLRKTFAPLLEPAIAE